MGELEHCALLREGEHAPALLLVLPDVHVHAIVTGASRGIGFALAEALGEEGFALTITARKPDTLETAANQLREKGVEVEYVAANMADEEGIREVVRHHRERFGRLDVLVNNAGVGVGSAAGEQQT